MQKPLWHFWPSDHFIVLRMLSRGDIVRERQMHWEFHKFKARNAVRNVVCTGGKCWACYLLSSALARRQNTKHPSCVSIRLLLKFFLSLCCWGERSSNTWQVECNTTQKLPTSRVMSRHLCNEINISKIY